MNLIFKKVKIKNFRSIQNAELDLQNQGIVKVIGHNLSDTKLENNGSGKSTIFEAIVYAITGDVSGESVNIANMYCDGESSVTLDFSLNGIDYTIIRKEKPKKSLTILKENLDISGNTLTKSKEILNNELGFINYDILTSIIILSNGLHGQLSSLKPSERKARLEYLTNISLLLNDVQERVDNSINIVNSKYSEIDSKKYFALGQMASLQQQNDANLSKIKEIQNYITKEQLDNLNQKKDTLLKRIEELTNKIDLLNKIKQEKDESLNTIKDELRQYNQVINDLNLQYRTFKLEKDNFDKQIQNYENQKLSAKDNICPTCGTKLSSTEKLLEHINSEINKITNEYSAKNIDTQMSSVLDQISNVQNTSIKSCNEKIENINKEIQTNLNELSNVKNELGNVNIELRETETELNKYNGDSLNIEQLEKLIETNKKSIDEFYSQSKQCEEELIKISKEQDIGKYFKNVLSRKFRNFLLSNTLNYLNERLSYYSSKLFDNGIVQLESDESKIEIKLGMKYFSDLSSGEKRRVDLLLIFAIRDLCLNETQFNCNLLVLDEALTYLDSEGIQNVINMIQLESVNVDSIYLVTQKEDLGFGADSTLIVTKYEEGNSVISYE